MLPLFPTSNLLTDFYPIIDEKELDPIMIEKSYFIAPDNKNKNGKAYSLLVKVLTETKKIALGKIVLKDKEHMLSLFDPIKE